MATHLSQQFDTAVHSTALSYDNKGGMLYKNEVGGHEISGPNAQTDLAVEQTTQEIAAPAVNPGLEI